MPTQEEIEISIHALLAESDILPLRGLGPQPQFLSTLSLRRATKARQSGTARNGYFYPRSPCGERRIEVVALIFRFVFLSTLSLRRATSIAPNQNIHEKFLSTLSLRRATSAGDCGAATSKDFYPRSPCGERLGSCYAAGGAFVFLSTLSLRRATLYVRNSGLEQLFLSTLSLRRATHKRPAGRKHDPFLSTLSLRRATLDALMSFISRRISIHALLAESDQAMFLL